MAPAFLAYCTSSVPRPCGRGRDHDHVVRARFGEEQDPHRRTARADHRDGLGEVEVLRDLVQPFDLRDGQLGVTAGHEAEVCGDPSAEPEFRDALPERLDDAG